MPFFRKKVFVWDAVQHSRKFLFANGHDTLEFVCARMDPALIGDAARFELCKEIFPDSWAYGAYCLAGLYNAKGTIDLIQYGKTKTGNNFDKATFDAYVNQQDILNDINARYKMLQLLFACNFNDANFENGIQTLRATGLDVQGKVHAELLTCAKYIMHIGQEFKIVSS